MLEYQKKILAKVFRIKTPKTENAKYLKNFFLKLFITRYILLDKNEKTHPKSGMDTFYGYQDILS